MTLTELPTPVAFTRTVLVGLDDLPGDLPPVPELPADPAAVGTAAPTAPVRRVDSKLSRTIASVVLLLVGTAGLAYARFGHPDRIPVPAPAVAISPAQDLAGGDPVLVDVGAHSGDVEVDLFVDGDWTGSDTSAPFTPEWEHRSPGEHELKAKITDGDGNVRYSAPILVEVPS